MSSAGQFGPYPFIDSRGNALPAVEILIYDSTGTTLASLYSDRARTPLANPLPTGVADGIAGVDTAGNAIFWADADEYLMVVRYGGTQRYQAPITISADPDDANAVLSVNGRSGIVIGLAEQTALATEIADRTAADLLLIPLTQRAAANGVATLDAGSKVPTAQLPALAITETFPVASQAAMLALTAQRGDVAIRTDLNKSFILSTDSPSTLADWKELLTPTDSVTSVNARVGVVSGLAEADASNVAASAAAWRSAIGAQAAGTYLTPANIDDTAYDATSWNGDTTHAPSKNAVRDKIETLIVGGLSLTPTAVKTSGYTAAVGDLVPVDTTSGAVTVTLPSAPADKATIAVKHVTRGGSNTVTIAAGGSDVFNKAAGATSLTLTLLNQAAILQYKASGGIWYVLADDLALSQLDSRYQQVVSHAADASVTRPSVPWPIIWIGSVAPTNIATDDLWIDTTTVTPTLSAPSLIVPPASLFTGSGDVAFFVQYGAFFSRFDLAVDGVYRYFRYRAGVSSGNIQCGVVKLSGTGMLDWTRVMSSGIIASPGTGIQKVDLGATTLVAGSYALFFWADNTTITVPNLVSASIGPTAATASPTLLSTGVLGTGTLAGWNGTRLMPGNSLEGNV